MTQEQPTTPAVVNDPTFKAERAGIIEAWTRNLLPDMALQVIGHIILGAILSSPDADDTGNFIAPEDEHITEAPEKYAVAEMGYAATTLSALLVAEQFSNIVAMLRKEYLAQIGGLGPILAGSLRVRVSLEGGMTAIIQVLAIRKSII